MIITGSSAGSPNALRGNNRALVGLRPDRIHAIEKTVDKNLIILENSHNADLQLFPKSFSVVSSILLNQRIYAR